jgi:hypothetical protein
VLLTDWTQTLFVRESISRFGTKRDKMIISFLESMRLLLRTWTSYAEVKKEICTFFIRIKKLNTSTEKKLNSAELGSGFIRPDRIQ